MGKTRGGIESERYFKDRRISAVGRSTLWKWGIKQGIRYRPRCFDEISSYQTKILLYELSEFYDKPLTPNELNIARS